MRNIATLTLALAATLTAGSAAFAADPPKTPAAPVSHTQSSGDALDAILAGSWRSEANKARDPYRHPKQTLTFFGIAPNQSVIEIEPAGGWYAEILAPWLKDHGQYIGAVFKAMGADAPDKYTKTLTARFAKDPEELGKAKLVEFDAKAPVFGPPASVDAVLTFRNVHNWTDAGTAAAMFKAMYAVLKPGGTLGVVDHRAKAGTTLEQNKSTGYLPVDAVIALASDAGFKLVAQSEINANPKDTKDYPKGVWTLPPTLTLKDVDRDKYLAIGESDRMTLKFVKPAK